MKPNLVKVSKGWRFAESRYSPVPWDYQRSYRGVTATLYVLACRELHKVGISKNFESRLRGLRDAIPFPVTKVATRTVPLAGVRVAEAWVHEQLAEYRVKGEWFAIEQEQALALLSAARWRAVRFDRCCQRYVDAITDEDRQRTLAEYQAEKTERQLREAEEAIMAGAA